MESPTSPIRDVAAPVLSKTALPGVHSGQPQGRTAVTGPPAAVVGNPRPQPSQPRVLTLRVTPLGLAIAAALVFSALALAFSLGRRMSFENAEPPEPPIVKTLEEIRTRDAVRYEDLEVDRGAMQSARGATEEIIR